MMINNIPAVIYGNESDKAFIFVHGKCGCKEEGGDFYEAVKEYGFQVLAADLPEHGERSSEQFTFNPWTAVPELKMLIEYAKTRWKSISVRANSIGAYFSMLAFRDEDIKASLFVSPVIDMYKLINNMMLAASITEDELSVKKEIATRDFGVLSYKYLKYSKEHPIIYKKPSVNILYAGTDMLTSRETVIDFAESAGAALSVTEDGEHWFHTPRQLEIMNSWIDECIKNNL